MSASNQVKYRIKYGTNETNIDVTNLCLEKCRKENIIHIPPDDNIRANLFTDPLFGVVKSLYIYRINDNGDIINSIPLYICDSNQYVYIDILNDRVLVNQTPKSLEDLFPMNYTLDRLREIQKKINIHHGDFSIEVPEQLMSMRYLKGDEKILEIGGNIGRNSMIMAYILNQKGNSQMLTLESDPEIAKQLIENRDRNGFQFQVESSALSKRKLIQGGRAGWVTYESDILLEGYKMINTITWEELKKKYPIDFDTLVLDCEGAFYNILIDTPEILDNIRNIFIENDFNDISHKNYMDKVLLEKGFRVEYSEDLDSGYYWFPNKKDFFQYWKR